MSKQGKNSFANLVRPLNCSLKRPQPKPEEKWRNWGHWGSVQTEEALALLCERGTTGSPPQLFVHELTQHRKQTGRISLLLHLLRYSFFGAAEIQWDYPHDLSSAGDAQRLFRRETSGREGGTGVHAALSWKGWQANPQLMGKGHKTSVLQITWSQKERN